MSGLLRGFVAAMLVGIVAGSADATDPRSIRPVEFTPQDGSFEGGQRVFVRLEGEGDRRGTASLTCRFAGARPVPGRFDSASGHYVCRVPPHRRPEPVPLTVRVGDVDFRMDAPYVYTTHGKYDAPVTEVHVPRLQERVGWVREQLPERVKLCAVLKNGNPPGWLGEAMAVATRIDAFCVPRVQDGIALRRAGVDTPIVVMYLSDAALAPLLLYYRLEPAAYSLAWVREAERRLENASSPLDVHLWIDTGISREGVLPDEALPLGRAIHRSRHLRLGGIATHFCCFDDADLAALEVEDLENPTALQRHRFEQVVSGLRAEGIGLDATLHASSSDGLRYGLTPVYYDMMRIGTMLFENPSPERRNYAWKTKISQIKVLPEGWCLNYGCEERFEQDTRVGLVAHIPDDEVSYYVNGQRVEKLLDHEVVVVLDLSDMPEVGEGEEVTMVFSGDDSPLDTSYSAPVTLLDEIREEGER
jgi:alanine racemase